MNKKISTLLLLIFALSLCSCKDKKASSEPSPIDSISGDSIESATSYISEGSSPISEYGSNSSEKDSLSSDIVSFTSESTSTVDSSTSITDNEVVLHINTSTLSNLRTEANKTENKVYAKNDVYESINNYTFKIYGNTFGFASETYNAGYASLGGLQAKKSSVCLESTSNLGVLNYVKITYISTYTDYLKLSVSGSSDGSYFNIEPKVEFSNTSATSATEGTQKNPIYSAVGIYTFDGDASYFRISNDNINALYISEIEISCSGDDSPYIPPSQEYIDSTDWTPNEKAILNKHLHGTLPYVDCFEYSITEEEDEYGLYAYAGIFTSSAKANDFFSNLCRLFELYSDDIGDYFENDQSRIEYYTYEEDDGIFIELFIYEIDEDDDDGNDDEKPVLTSGITLNAETLKNTLSDGAYNKTDLSCTIDGVSFSFPTGTSMISGEARFGTTKALQIKKNVNFLKNTSPISNLTTISVTYFQNQSGSFNKLTISGGNSYNGDYSVTSSEKSSNTKIGTFPGLTVIYTFDSPVSYISMDNKGGAAYIDEIVIGSSSGETRVDLIDDGNGYKNIDLSKAKFPTVTDLPDFVDTTPTKGNVNVLVIPVEFPDCTAASKGYTTQTLDTAFNGPSDGLKYYSVKDYFALSSYGKLNLSFDVCDSFFRASHNSSYYEDLYKNADDLPFDIYGYDGKDSTVSPEAIILDEALSYLDSQGYDFTDYDSNGDFAIDAVIMVYTVDYSLNDDSLFWAWQFFNTLGDTDNVYMEDGYEDGYEYFYYDECYAESYLWASFDFLFDECESPINTFTFCHEFSHCLGCSDYYDYNDNYYPTHDFDMMDDSYADHTAYSKMILGWIDNARIVTCSEKVTLTLSSIQDGGNVILLANSFDETFGVFQEYYVIEYCINKGANAKGGLFDEEGILVHHVDATLDRDLEYGDDYYFIRNDNSSYDPSSSVGTEDNLYELIANGEEYIFGVNDTLGAQQLNCGSQLGFDFKIISIENGVATIEFTNLTFKK